MPTVGWILERDIEAFLGATTVVPETSGPPLPRYYCPFCSASFPNSRELQDHMGADHTGQRPVLTLAGVEPKSVETIRKSISPRDVQLFHATDFFLSRDGSKFSHANIGDLRETLGEVKTGRVWLRLENRFHAKAQPVQSAYDLTLRVYDAEALASVDRLFVERLGRIDVHLVDVDGFLRASEQFPADEYACALAEYVVGILIKDSDPSTGVSIVDRDYRPRLNGSLRILEQYDRPLSRLICSLLRFSGNDFEASKMDVTGFQLLDAANAKIGLIAKGGGGLTIRREEDDWFGERLTVCPIDNGSDFVMRLADRLSSVSRWSPDLQQHLEAQADLHDLDPLDREKIWALWAQAALSLGKAESSLVPLRMLAGNYCFGQWALEKLQEIER